MGLFLIGSLVEKPLHLLLFTRAVLSTPLCLRDYKEMTTFSLAMPPTYRFNFSLDSMSILSPKHPLFFSEMDNSSFFLFFQRSQQVSVVGSPQFHVPTADCDQFQGRMRF